MEPTAQIFGELAVAVAVPERARGMILGMLILIAVNGFGLARLPVAMVGVSQLAG